MLNLNTASYLKLSNLAYYNVSEKQTLLLASIPEGYKFIYSQSILYAPDKAAGYEGLAFYNKNENNLIVASSGTSINDVTTDTVDFYQDLVSDFSLLDKTIPPAFAFAYAFAKSAYSLIDNSNTTSVKFTGHSLGSCVSELLTAQFISDGINASAVTFDSPGSKQIIEQHWGKEVAAKVHDNVITHNGAANIINTVNQQVGQVSQLSYHGKNAWLNIGTLHINNLIEKYALIELKAFLTSTLFYKSHKMDVFLSELNTTSGEFYSETAAPNWNTDNPRPGITSLVSKTDEFGDIFDSENMAQVSSFITALESLSSGLTQVSAKVYDGMVSLEHCAENLISTVMHSNINSTDI